MFADLIDVNRIRLTQDVQFRAGDFTGAANGQTWTREGVAPDKAVGEAQFTAGNPPTLWWDLMVTDGPPLNETDSITSG